MRLHHGIVPVGVPTFAAGSVRCWDAAARTRWAPRTPACFLCSFLDSSCYDCLRRPPSWANTFRQRRHWPRCRGLVKDAERGEGSIVERHGHAVAAVISVKHFDELERARNDLIDGAFILARELSDTGNRTDLDDAISAFGVDRTELERGTRKSQDA